MWVFTTAFTFRGLSTPLTLLVSSQPTTRLTTVRSDILRDLGDLNEPKNLHGKEHFQSEGQRRTLDRSVGELQDANGEYRLSFGVPPGGRR
jgi:hypothetical protein